MSLLPPAGKAPVESISAEQEVVEAVIEARRAQKVVLHLVDDANTKK